MNKDNYLGRIILLCGLPASGKSTFARKYFKEDLFAIFNVDDFRTRLCGINYNEIGEGFLLSSIMICSVDLAKQNKTVIIDDCHATIESRKKWIDVCRKNNIVIECRYINTGGPFEYKICCKRNDLRDQSLPDEVMEAINDRFVPPNESEGFSVIRKINDVGR